MRKTFTESNVLRDTVLESAEDKGLDTDLYLAVIKAELGRGGVVNMNNRIYDVNEFIRENNKLAKRVEEGFVEGELGHPMGGPTFDVPVQLKEVYVDVDEDQNTAMASGSFAILNTQSGRDVLTLYNAGMPVGTSSRGTGTQELHTIDEDSPYYKANRKHLGKDVNEVKEFSLLTYDLVRVPSAGTHFQAATTECQEALARLVESGHLGESSNPTEEDMVEENKVAVTPDVVEAEEVSQVVEEEVVETSEVEESVETCAEEVAPEEAVTVEESKSDAPELSPEQLAAASQLFAVLDSAGNANGDDLAEEIKRVAEQAEVDRVRLAEAEAANKELEERLCALTEEIEAKKKAEATRKAVEESVEGMNHGDEIRKEVEALVSEGRIESADEIKVWSQRLSALVESAVSKSVDASGVARVVAVDASDDLVEASESEEDKVEAPGIIEESYLTKIERILAKPNDR